MQVTGPTTDNNRKREAGYVKEKLNQERQECADSHPELVGNRVRSVRVVLQ